MGDTVCGRGRGRVVRAAAMWEAGVTGRCSVRVVGAWDGAGDGAHPIWFVARSSYHWAAKCIFQRLELASRPCRIL